MNQIRNIYCVGRNYISHAKELNNAVPSSPLFFSKPTHALVEAHGQEIILPGDRGTVHFEVEFVIRIDRPYTKGLEVDKLVGGMALGIDFTLRDVQDELKKKGHPWLAAKGFPNSAVISKFIEFPGIKQCEKVDFALLRNGKQVQLGNIKEMVFDLQTIVDFAAEHFGLGKGDIIFTGTPQGVGPVSNGDRLSLLLGEQVLGECIINLV